jgi:hypothetical protein
MALPERGTCKSSTSRFSGGAAERGTSASAGGATLPGAELALVPLGSATPSALSVDGSDSITSPAHSSALRVGI